MGNSALVWWLLGAPIVLAIIDRMRMAGTSAMSGGRSMASAPSR